MAIKGSQTRYPQTFQQPYPHSNQADWHHLSNLKTESSNPKQNYANTDIITGKNGNQPGVEQVYMRNFGFNLPEGAEVESIIVNLDYGLGAKVTGKYPKLGTFYMRGLGWYDDVNAHTSTRQYCVAPSKDWTHQRKTYNDNNCDIPLRSYVNHEYFGLAFVFNKNTNDNHGYLYMNNVSITINYKIPEYTVNVVASAENDEYIKDKPFNLEFVLNNPDLMGYVPTMEITAPSDMNITPVGMVAEVTWRKINDTTYQWKPPASSIESSRMETREVYDATTGKYVTMTVPIPVYSGAVSFKCTATSGSTGVKSITITEKYGNHNKTTSVNVIGQSIIVPEDVKMPSEQTLYAIQNIPFVIPIKVPENLVGTQFYLYTDKDLKILENGSYTSVNAGNYYTIPTGSFGLDGTCNLTAKDTNDIDPYPTALNVSHTEIVKLYLTTENTGTPESISFVVKVVPESYDIPRLTVMKLSAEECNRLGDGFNYSVESNIRINCQSSYVNAYVDFYRNFRIGVVNSIQETLELDDIFYACKDWSDGLTVLNDFQKDSVEFTYDKDYPVYIILTGNYDSTIANYFEVEYTSPQIIEANREDGADTVLFPVPIQDIISDVEESISDLTLPSANTSNNLIFYKLPLEDTFNDKRNLAVRGIAVRVTANSDYVSTISAKLHSPKGGTGVRSILLDATAVHTIGGSNDRWGFNISELADIANFELELNIVNNSGNPSNVSIEKVEFIVYYTFYETQIIDWLIEGENMAGFNCFLQDVVIPEGLKTNTKYLTVDGTDQNNAFRQNIKEKKITVEFDIDECNLKEATATLQDVTEMLMTQRDASFRPIPKTVEFSHYPGLYWEYIMEDTIDAEVETTSYKCKVKLTVPSGTAYTKEELVTGKSGRVAGLAKINPVILVTPTGGNHIEISDTFSNQKFTMSYNTWTTNDTVEIDCANRKIILHQNDETIDITAYADANTDWFLISDQFYLDETGCIIQSVTWTERK